MAVVTSRPTIRIAAAAEQYGVSRSTVERDARVGRIRSWRIEGRRIVMLDAEDCEKRYGAPEPEVTAEVRAVVWDLARGL